MFRILFALIIFLSSCSVTFNTSKSKKSSIESLSNVELSKFRIDGDHVFFDDKKVARIGNMEYEYFKGNYIMEVSMIQYSPIYNEMTEKIVYFMSNRYPNAKIEVKVVRDDLLDQN